MAKDLCGYGEFLQIHGFVPKDKCEDWTRRILADRKNWSPKEKAFIYGKAYYNDIEAGDVHLYHRHSQSVNKMISKLPGLTEAMVSSTKHLVGPKGVTGLPARSRNETLGKLWVDTSVFISGQLGDGPFHTDYQGFSPYPWMMFDKKTHGFTAVICVSAPEQGGGVKIWPKRYLANEDFDPKDVTPVSVDYPQGTLTIFDSFFYHQVLGSPVSRLHYRMVAVMHIAYQEKPAPHWEYWY